MMVSATCAVDQAPTDAITDTYDYDAFGNEVHSTGSTPNNFLYRGEQWDSDLGLYYLRARYYNTMTDRFVSRDPEDGIVTDPTERCTNTRTQAGILSTALTRPAELKLSRSHRPPVRSNMG